MRAKILQDESNEALLFMLEKAGIVIYEKRINDSIDAYSFGVKIRHLLLYWVQIRGSS